MFKTDVRCTCEVRQIYLWLIIKMSWQFNQIITFKSDAFLSKVLYTTYIFFWGGGVRNTATCMYWRMLEMLFMYPGEVIIWRTNNNALGITFYPQVILHEDTYFSNIKMEKSFMLWISLLKFYEINWLWLILNGEVLIIICLTRRIQIFPIIISYYTCTCFLLVTDKKCQYTLNCFPYRSINYCKNFQTIQWLQLLHVFGIGDKNSLSALDTIPTLTHFMSHFMSS